MPKVTVEGNELVIRLPIAPGPSKSGKTTIVAGTSGFVPTPATFEGKPISVSVNACVKK